VRDRRRLQWQAMVLQGADPFVRWGVRCMPFFRVNREGRRCGDQKRNISDVGGDPAAEGTRQRLLELASAVATQRRTKKRRWAG
jgi:hypothetical protein